VPSPFLKQQRPSEIVEFFRKQDFGTPIGMTRVFEMIQGGRKKPRTNP
jgi:hypothetical protein